MIANRMIIIIPVDYQGNSRSPYANMHGNGNEKTLNVNEYEERIK